MGRKSRVRPFFEFLSDKGSRRHATDLFRRCDRLPEEDEAVGEETEPDAADDQELAPDGADAPAPIDDHLRKADEVPGRKKVRGVLEPLRLALDRGAPAR